MIIGMEKSGKILENCNADLENADVCWLPMHLLIYLQFMTQISEVQSSEIWVPFGI